MLVFAGLAHFACDKVKSRVLTGFVGVLLVCLSVFASLGLTAAVGTEFTPTITQVLPFLALGLGVDDMFVVTASFHAAFGNNAREKVTNITIAK